jgi:hypothetical protein
VKVIVGRKMVSNLTRDLLWGVRRGGNNGINLGDILSDNKKKSKK